MKAISDFIIELKNPLNDTFITENGVELYANKEFSVDRLSNRVAKVIAVPVLNDSGIKPGYEVMIEPTILYKQIYMGVKQHYNSLLDQEKMYFKVTPNMIVLYRENENKEWSGHLKNTLVEPIKHEEKITSSFLEIPKSKEKYEKEIVKVKYTNSELKEYGVEDGDTVYIDPAGGVKFWIEGKEYWWLLNKFVLAKKCEYEC